MTTPMTWDDLLRICPYRVLVCAAGAMPLPVNDPHIARLQAFDADGATYAFFGYGTATFDPSQRSDILARLRDGDTLLLVAMEPAMLDSALHSLALDLTTPAGRA
jgi:hypothetical protein